MANEIIDNLWVGDMTDAMNFDGFIICVLEGRPSSEPPNATWIPILKYDDHGNVFAERKQMDIVISVIDGALKRGDKTLVHCAAGIERSPLTIVYYLWKKKGISINDAYKLVISKRSEVQDRRTWLNLTYDENQG